MSLTNFTYPSLTKERGRNVDRPSPHTPFYLNSVFEQSYCGFLKTTLIVVVSSSCRDREDGDETVFLSFPFRLSRPGDPETTSRGPPRSWEVLLTTDLFWRSLHLLPSSLSRLSLLRTFVTRHISPTVELPYSGPNWTIDPSPVVWDCRKGRWSSV